MSRERILLDSHTHTIASGHAYNTINEMIHAAADKGLELLGITEHAPKMPGTCDEIYFQNFRALPREREGVKLVFGAEINVLDTDGSIDLAPWTLNEIDLGIVSMHTPCFTSVNAKENTMAYVNAIKEPHINIIGHPDDARFPIDAELLVKAAKDAHVLIELNNNSLNPNGFRDDPRETDLKILEYCVKYDTPIILGSDAHIDLDIAKYNFALSLVDEVGFPKELIVNYSVEQYLEYVPFAKVNK